MIAGTIKLLNSHELLLKTRSYSGKKERAKIIDSWEKYLDEELIVGMIQITPSSNISFVRKDGTNGRNPRENKTPPQLSIIRPPAKYDNRSFS